MKGRGVRPYDIRHIGASEMLAAEADLAEIAAQMGNSSIQIAAAPHAQVTPGGYPCQPFSTSGRRQGVNDPRHLWPHVRRILHECGAPLLCIENVQGHVSLGLEAVCRDLQKMGFRVEAGIFSAYEVGASHLRKRLFLLAYTDIQILRHLAQSIAEGRQALHDKGGLPVRDSSGGGNLDASLYDGGGPGQGFFPPDAGDFATWDIWLAAQPDLQPALAGSHDGLAHKLDRYRLTGNGVVSLEAAYALATLATNASQRE